MSVLSPGGTTRNSSIYNRNYTDNADWRCAIILFDNNDFINDIEVICKMPMNINKEIY